MVTGFKYRSLLPDLFVRYVGLLTSLHRNIEVASAERGCTTRRGGVVAERGRRLLLPLCGGRDNQDDPAAQLTGEVR